MQAFLEFNLLPIWFKTVIVIISGLSVGSFLTLLSHRLVTGENIIIARSKCVTCNKVLKAINLIPLLSWIGSKGRCSCGQSKISWRYPLIELASGLLFLVILLVNTYQISWVLVVQCLIAANLLLMIITDLEHYFIPNQSQFSLAFLVAILLLLETNNIADFNIWPHLIGAFSLLGFALFLLGFFYVSTKKQAIGVDDIKFFFIAGFFVTLEQFLLFTLLTGLFGVMFGLVWKAVKKEDTFPFAPAMCVALLVIILFGKKIDLIEFGAWLLF